jgi:hypothetical protein
LPNATPVREERFIMRPVYKTRTKESTGIEEEIFLKKSWVEIHKSKVMDWIGKLTGKIQYKEAK